MKTAVCTSPHFTRHVTPFGHPETPQRAVVIQKALKELPGLVWLQPRHASYEELFLAHDPSYVALVKNEVDKLAPRQLALLSTGDVTICPESFEVATLAAGAVLTAVDQVMQHKSQNAFCVVRPPGHHATQNRGMGFCLFNNVAIGARYVQKTYGVERVLIVDWDLHHGNGTQDIFYEDPTVFYFSTHQMGIYPGTGTREERGVGTTLNCPILPGKGSAEAVLSAFTEELFPAMEKFKPQFVIISCGFDAHHKDPLGQLLLSEEHFALLTDLVKQIASQWAEDRLVSVLEGGYNLEAITTASLTHVSSLLK